MATGLKSRIAYKEPNTSAATGEYWAGTYKLLMRAKSIPSPFGSQNMVDKVGEEGCLQFVAFEVAPSTICQCTGLKDKNGKLIWENDIVMTVYDGNEHIYQVVWDESELDFKATNGKENYESNFEYLPCCDEIEILGNCFDNPELLEEEE